VRSSYHAWDQVEALEAAAGADAAE